MNIYNFVQYPYEIIYEFFYLIYNKNLSLTPMRYLKKFNELKSSTYISASDKLSKIDYDEYEDTIHNLDKHAELMRVINNENGRTSNEVINIFKDIMKLESMWDKIYKKSNEIYNDYIKSNIHKVDRSERKKVRAEANKLSSKIREPYFKFRIKIQKDTMKTYGIKIGDVFKLGNKGEFILTKFTDIQYFFDNPNTYTHERIDITDLPLKIENGDIEKLDIKTIFNEETNKWEFYKEEEEPIINETLREIKKWFEDYKNGGDFSLADDGVKFISYATREHGNVGNETPGQEDINNAIKIKNQLLRIYKGKIQVDIEEVDEWVYINIETI